MPQAPWSVQSGGNDDSADKRSRLDTEEDNNDDEAEESVIRHQDSNPNQSAVVSGITAGANVSDPSDFPVQPRDSPITVCKTRKGRNSVEEIVSDAVCRFLSAKACRMHPCGREDIDVRVLGNGRPFALEVIEPAELPTEDQLRTAVEYIANGNGLNSMHDIEVLFLERSDRALWEGMQVAAEEKDKAYRCIVYSERKLTRSDIVSLESISQEASTDLIRSLSILQKTPLRVLHRRSLLTRTRYISQLRATLLNEHYFILSLVTSAGTYVKEFVHGDFGRTSPSISDILDTHADILQLDVTWLYDEFRGGGKPSEQATQSCLIQDQYESVSLDYLKMTKLIPLKTHKVISI